MPRKGCWTLPAGYLEENESAEAGASREAMEEVGASIKIDALLAVYSIPRIGQVQIFYRARLTNTPAPGPETLELALFTWDDIPWKELAFPSVRWALDHYRETASQPAFAPFANPPGTDSLTR